jgi:hypothetical protein
MYIYQEECHTYTLTLAHSHSHSHSHSHTTNNHHHHHYQIALATRTLGLLRSLIEETNAKGRRPSLSNGPRRSDTDDLSIPEWLERVGGIKALKLRLSDLLPPARRRDNTLAAGTYTGPGPAAEKTVWRQAGVRWLCIEIFAFPFDRQGSGCEWHMQGQDVRVAV